MSMRVDGSGGTNTASRAEQEPRAGASQSTPADEQRRAGLFSSLMQEKDRPGQGGSGFSSEGEGGELDEDGLEFSPEGSRLGADSLKEGRTKMDDTHTARLGAGGYGGGSEEYAATSGQQLPPDGLSAMFSSLMSQSAAPTEAVVQTAPALDESELQELSDRLVDRILVSEPKLDGSREVRLELQNSNLLRDTSITLMRDLNGMLFVNISSSDAVSLRRLAEARSRLESRLDEQEKGAVRVEVTDSSPSVSEQSERPDPRDYFAAL
ncbi:MAG: hypothetical protein IJ228_10635 [Succinivibrio sp.]|nr:hypothetical protein [Succinivibrio sp.]